MRVLCVRARVYVFFCRPPHAFFSRPKWNFDGSSTGQAPGEDSEVILYPQAIYPDPFRGGDNIMVMCDCYKPDGTPIDNNTRKECAEIMAKVGVDKERERGVLVMAARPPLLLAGAVVVGCLLL